MKLLTKLSLLLIITLVICGLASCKGGKKIMYAQIILTTGEKINLELYRDIAPKSVDNFIKLANDNYYNGAIFHRVIADFMIQTGGYTVKDNTLVELPKTEPIYGEFSSNGYDKNTLSHELGVISMARTNDKNSATGQFFLCSTSCSWLDGEYAAFGRTTDEESNNVILKISQVPTGVLGYGFENFPYDLIVIEKILIDNKKF